MRFFIGVFNGFESLSSFLPRVMPIAKSRLVFNSTKLYNEENNHFDYDKQINEQDQIHVVSFQIGINIPSN